MSDYRPKSTPTQETPQQAIEGSNSAVSNVEVEPPFTSYETDKGHPFLVDHFELGSYWKDAGYEGEVETINTYLNHLVNTGDINNTLESVRGKLKSIEKMINVPKDSRTAYRVGQVAAYIEFLIKADNIKKDSAKYGLR